MDIIVIIGIILGLIGAIASVWYIYEKMFPLRRISWKLAEKSANSIADKLKHNGYIPSLIIGIGRGGAIMGALLSGCLGHITLLTIDRKYAWMDGRRIDDMVLHLKFPPSLLEKVLLVAGETHSGNTMRLYYNYFKDIGAKNIKRAALFYEKGCTEPIEYYGIKHYKDLRMPWMFNKYYIRDSRDEEEAKSLSSIKSTTNIIDSIHTNFKTCYIIRHGESADNFSGDRYSGITDSLLTEKGVIQGHLVGKKLSSEKVDVIYTSPMQRAIKTARNIQINTGGYLTIDQRLREMDFGDWEGLTRKDVNEKWEELYRNYKEDPLINIPPNGESPQRVLERASDFWQEFIWRMFLENHNKAIIVTHKSIIRILLFYLQKKSLAKYRDTKIDNASITRIDFDEKGEIKIIIENDIQHLVYE